MTRRAIARTVSAVIVAAVAATAPAAYAVDAPTLTKGPAAKFPERSWLLTLPDKRALETGDVEVYEDGERVGGLRVRSSAVAGSAVVLAIDASTSMRGKPIRDAMAAARSFVDLRRPDQQLGVIFFSRDARVALEPTTDVAQIDAVLAGVPELTTGTRLYDAAEAARGLAAATGAGVSSVVLLSDGADGNSSSEPDTIVAAADKDHVRFHTVGLRSGRFDPAGLRALGVSGSYTEASSSQQLDRIFTSLGERVSNEYVITYRSESPLDARVAVTATIDGLDRSAVAAYETPHLDVRLFDPEAASSELWSRKWFDAALAGMIALLLALAVFLLLRPRRRPLWDRVSGFVGTAPTIDNGDQEVAASTPLLLKADERLDRLRWWRNFVLDLELAKVRTPAIRVTLFTVSGTVVLMVVLGLLVGPVAAVLALLIPVAVRVFASVRAGRVRRAFDEQLPDNLQVLASALRAGHSFTGALSVMTHDAGEPSRSEFGRVVGDDQLGVPIEESMGVVADRMRNPDVGYIGLVATIQRETGGNTAEVLDRVTTTVRERSQLRRLVKTLTAQGRLGGWVVTLLPVAVVTFLTAVEPDYLDPLLQSPAGRFALGLGVVLLGFGAFIVHRIVDIDV
jgi:tight adherence protein B